MRRGVAEDWKEGLRRCSRRRPRSEKDGSLGVVVGLRVEAAGAKGAAKEMG